MTELKLHCYIKSFGHDVSEVKNTVVGIIKFLSVPVVCLLLFVGLMAGIYYIIPILKAALNQYQGYLLSLTVFYLLAMYLIYKIEQNHSFNICFELIFVTIVTMGMYLLNQCIIEYPESRTFSAVGWSYMTGETIVVYALALIGVFLIRGYVRCEKPIKKGAEI
jgi:hypothetical protein